MKEENRIRGKKNRISGTLFEKRVRKDLEKSYIVSRWGNNIKDNKLVPAKSTRFRSNTHGFPDFICFRHIDLDNYKIIGVECKSNGYLKPEERAKCKWLLENNIFSRIIISSKGLKRGEIIYKEWK